MLKEINVTDYVVKEMRLKRNSKVDNVARLEARLSSSHKHLHNFISLLWICKREEHGIFFRVQRAGKKFESFKFQCSNFR